MFKKRILSRYHIEASVAKPAFLDSIKDVAGFKTLDAGQRKELLTYAAKVNEEWYRERLGGGSDIVLLYHGSPEAKIEHEGLQVKEGRRSGFMGSEKRVQNHGVFMTDSKATAHYFGENRAEHRNDYKVYEAFTKLGKLLDVYNPAACPAPLKKLGLELVNKYNNTTKTKLANSDIWWLLDLESFVSAVKTAGYNSVRFKEAPHIGRESGDSKSSTYLIFNINNLIVRSSKNDKIKSLEDLISP